MKVTLNLLSLPNLSCGVRIEPYTVSAVINNAWTINSFRSFTMLSVIDRLLDVILDLLSTTILNPQCEICKRLCYLWELVALR